MPEPEPSPRAQRMHAGGKLSFRRRVKVSDSEALPFRIGGEDPPPLHELVPDAYHAVEIEVGSGKGTFVLAATELRPDTFMIGIEASAGYARFAAERLDKTGRTNGLFLVDNAKLYLQDRVPAHALQRLHVYFPDPWPKRRHRKRRFFSDEMPETIARALHPHGHLLVATDNAAYAGQICVLLGASSVLVRDEAEEQRLLAGPPGIGFGPTNFERKYLEAGRILRRYAFRPTAPATFGSLA